MGDGYKSWAVCAPSRPGVESHLHLGGAPISQMGNRLLMRGRAEM